MGCEVPGQCKTSCSTSRKSKTENRLITLPSKPDASWASVRCAPSDRTEKQWRTFSLFAPTDHPFQQSSFIPFARCPHTTAACLRPSQRSVDRPRRSSKRAACLPPSPQAPCRTRTPTSSSRSATRCPQQASASQHLLLFCSHPCAHHTPMRALFLPACLPADSVGAGAAWGAARTDAHAGCPVRGEQGADLGERADHHGAGKPELIMNS